MRILICEDNPVIALDLEMTLEEMGHEAAGHVTRSDKCLAHCRAAPPDLVLVDIDLADGPMGPGLTVQLADMGIPSVIVSGQTDELAAEDHAALRVLTKPVAASDLKAALVTDRLLGSRPGAVTAGSADPSADP